MFGLEFATPALLIGLAAAAIPFLLHLLSSVRAPEVYFPTLRFLRRSMEKTARRRRIQHWLLLAVRSLMLAALALAVAEPVFRRWGGWNGSDYAAVLVVDNSYSMLAGNERQSRRLDRALQQANEVLSGEARPALAAVMTTNGGPVGEDLSGDMAQLRNELATVRCGYGRAPLAMRVASAIDMLGKARSVPRKCLYVFSDMQRLSFEELSKLQALAAAGDIHLFVINVAEEKPDNVGIADLEISGRRIVDQSLELTARLINSSASDRKVGLVLRIDGKQVDQPVIKDLRAAGREGCIETATFAFRLDRPGVVEGELALVAPPGEPSQPPEPFVDDLAVDNSRRFCLDVAGRASALIVAGQVDQAGLPDGASVLWAWLSAGASPRSVEPRLIQADRLTRSDLAGVGIAFFADVPQLTDWQGQALLQFVQHGGTAFMFLGPSVKVDNYNKTLRELLGAELLGATGEVGSLAQAQQLGWVELDHPYFGQPPLWPHLAEYLVLQVQRYFRLAPAGHGRVLMRLANGDPLLMERQVGQGRLVLCTTTASPHWSNAMGTGAALMLPVVDRAALSCQLSAGRDNTYQCGWQVAIRPAKDAGPAALPIKLLLPSDDGKEKTVTIEAAKSPAGYVATFANTDAPGRYVWRADKGGEGAEGVFVVNPVGSESDLLPMSASELTDAVAKTGAKSVHVAPTVAQAHAAAAGAAAGQRWWDVLAALAIVLLVAEAVLANRRKLAEQIMPAQLNPRLTP